MRGCGARSSRCSPHTDMPVGSAKRRCSRSVPARRLRITGWLSRVVRNSASTKLSRSSVSGGMGEVYRARDTQLGRDVAIKVLPAAFVGDRGAACALRARSAALASLNHPHIGAIYGVEEAGGVRGLVMELVDGETLAERIARGADRRRRCAADRDGKSPRHSKRRTNKGLFIAI